MSRLSTPLAQYPLWPVQYLLGCYARALDEVRSTTMLKDASDQQQLADALALVRQLTVSYAGFLVSMGMFPQPPEAEQRGGLQLLDSLYAATGSATFVGGGIASQPLIPAAVTAATAVVPMPPSFLEEYVARFQDEGIEDTLKTIGAEIGAFYGAYFSTSSLHMLVLVYGARFVWLPMNGLRLISHYCDVVIVQFKR